VIEVSVNLECGAYPAEYLDALLATRFNQNFGVPKKKRMLIDPDHHFGCLYDRVDLRAFPQVHLFCRGCRDGGDNLVAAGNGDNDFGTDRAFLDHFDGSRYLVSCTDLHCFYLIDHICQKIG